MKKRWIKCLILTLCLLSGIFFASGVITFSSHDEQTQAEYTTTFKRTDSLGVGFYVQNCANGVSYQLSAGKSVTITTSSTKTIWYFYTTGGATNYNFTVNGQSGFQYLYYQTNSSSATYNVSVTAAETNFGLTYFDAGYNGGSFQRNRGYEQGAAHSNKVYWADTLIGTYAERNYYKKYTGEAYCAWFWVTSRWAYPMLVGKTADSVVYYQDYDYNNTNYAGTLTFKGETWYFSGWGPLMQDVWNDATDYQAFIGTMYYPLHTFDVFDEDGNWLYEEDRTFTTDLELRRFVAEKMLLTLDTEVALWEQGFSGGGIQFPDSPYKPYHAFTGWYTSPSGGTKITSSSAKAGQNRRLYAQYAYYDPSYIYIVPDDEGFGFESFCLYTTSTISYDYLNEELLWSHGYEFDDFYYEGHHIAGLSVGYGGRVYTLSQWRSGISMKQLCQDLYNWNGEDAYLDNALTLYVVWEENYNTFTFDLNGGYEVPPFYADDYYEGWYGTIYVPDDYEVARTGYTLTGWYLYGDGGIYQSLSKGNSYYVSNLIFDDMDGFTFTIEAQWEIKVFQFTIKWDAWNPAPVHSTEIKITANGATSVNGDLTISRGETITLRATYSTSAIAISGAFTNTSRLYYFDYYVNGEYHSWGNNNTPITYSWTPTNDINTIACIIENMIIVTSGDEGVSSAESGDCWSDTADPAWSTGRRQGLQGTGLILKATIKPGYIFEGWYDSNGTKLSTSSEFTYCTRGNSEGGGLTVDLTATAKTKKTYDLIKYTGSDGIGTTDSRGNYFYFEDGYYPQTYAGDSLNSTLNSWYSSQSSTCSYYIGSSLYYGYTYTDGKKYVRINCQKTYTVKLKSGSSKTFSVGTYYWFKVEPIRWRVSDYGVSANYYSTTLYSRFVNAGCVNGVSEYVLDFGSHVASGQKISEGWSSSTDSQINTYVRINDSNANCLSYLTTNKEFDYFNNTGTNKKVLQTTLAVAGFHQASVNDIGLAGITDYKAKASDLVCMLAGTNSDAYCNYSTRDLYDLSSGRYITADGTVRTWWLNIACGVRLAYSSTGKSA